MLMLGYLSVVFKSNQPKGATMMNKTVLMIVTMVAILLAQESMTLNYQEKTKKNIETFSTSLYQEGSSIKTVFKNREQVITSWGDSRGATTRLEQQDVQSSQTVHVVREGEQLKVTSGSSRNSIKIDKAPWFGDISNVKSYIRSGNRQQLFWIVSADFGEMDDVGKGLVALKMRMKRKEYKNITVNGKSIRARRYVVTMADWRAILWKAEYWFDSDGFMVKSSQKRGGPFTPKTIVTLLSREEK